MITATDASLPAVRAGRKLPTVDLFGAISISFWGLTPNFFFNAFAEDSEGIPEGVDPTSPTVRNASKISISPPPYTAFGRRNCI